MSWGWRNWPSHGWTDIAGRQLCTPVEILLMLAQDSSPLVAEQAALHPNWPEDLTSWALGDEWIDK